MFYHYFLLVKPYYVDGSFDSGIKRSDEGKRVEIKCEPSGSPMPIKIIWEKNNVRYKETNTDDPNLVFTNVTRNDIGTYACKASNLAGSAERNPSTQLFVSCKCPTLCLAVSNPLPSLTNIVYYHLYRLHQLLHTKLINEYVLERVRPVLIGI